MRRTSEKEPKKDTEDMEFKLLTDSHEVICDLIRNEFIVRRSTRG
jgi:hypothetical protein